MKNLGLSSTGKKAYAEFGKSRKSYSWDISAINYYEQFQLHALQGQIVVNRIEKDELYHKIDHETNREATQAHSKRVQRWKSNHHTSFGDHTRFGTSMMIFKKVNFYGF